MITKHRLLSSSAGALLTIALAASTLPRAARAQQTSAPASSSEATVELPPFEVRTEQDSGYLAQNTASGSRLNTSLRDTPAPISVFTAEFIQDIGATDIESISEYMMNTDRDMGFVRETPQGNTFATSDRAFRVRGLPTDFSGGRSVNFFRRTIEIDTFNTERIEVSRGPNSILFGQSTAGTFNTITKKADPKRPRYEASLRAGNFDAFRATIDLNAPVVTDKVALRLNAAHDTKNSWRPHEFKDQDRLHLAAHFRAGPKTTLDVEYERADITQSLHRPWLGFDSITNWIALGQQIDPAAGTPIPGNAGLVNINANHWYTYDSETGLVYNMRNQSQSAATGLTALKDRKMLYEFDLVPREATLFGPAVGSEIEADITSAFLRHELLPKLNVELAYNRQQSSFNGRDVNQNIMAVVYDTNAQLPTREPNPNVRRPYIEGEWFNRNRHEQSDDYRLTASYEFDLGKIWGRHRIAGLGEYRDDRIQNEVLFEVVTQNPPNVSSPDHAQNRIHRRTYIDLAGPVANIALADYREHPISGLTNLSTNQPISTGFVPNANMRDDRFKTTTGMAVVQNRFWHNRIVTTFGYREDRIDTYRSEVERGPAYGPFAVGDWRAVPATSPTQEDKGSTRTQGIVFHATPSIALFYNRSSSFNTPDRTRTIFPRDQLPPPIGRGEDFGVKLTLLGGRLFATASYYETAARRDSDNLNVGTVTNPTNSIWETLDNAGILAAHNLTLDGQTLVANGYLFDSDSQGYEFELVANPTTNWRLSLNFSDNKTINSNVAREVRAYYDEWRDFMLSGDRSRLVIEGNGNMAAQAIDPNDGLTTIAERLDSVESFVTDEFIRPEGTRVKGSPRYSVNFRTNYSFTGERLKGFAIGGGARWRAAPIVGYTSPDPAVRQEISGSETLLFDLNASYRRRVELFGKRTEWLVQLNVNNLLDDDDIIVGRAFDDGSIRTYSFQTPRTWFVTTTVRF